MTYQSTADVTSTCSKTEANHHLIRTWPPKPDRIKPCTYYGVLVIVVVRDIEEDMEIWVQCPR